MTSLRVVCGDPGRSGDPFAVVGVQYEHSNYDGSGRTSHKIHIKLAKQFIKRPYSDVAKYLYTVQKNIRPNHMAIETNNRGKRVLQLFKEKYKLQNIRGVATSSNMSETARNTTLTLDKAYMINWLKQKLEVEKMIVFPCDATGDIKELMNQIPQIVSYQTPSGRIGYHADRGRHDDLVMALLHCCNYIRIYIDRKRERE